MAYVKDLENMNQVGPASFQTHLGSHPNFIQMYIIPLRDAEPPVIPPDRLDQFIQDVFHNYDELYEYHRRLVEKFLEIQREQHPIIRTVTAPLFDAALNFRDAYLEYIPNYPIAAYRIDDEMANNPAFKAFVEVRLFASVFSLSLIVYRPLYGIQMLIAST